MALHLSDQNVAHQIADRIRHLIARQDDGDVTTAARRLERPIADVYSCERLISCGDELAAVDFLATVVRTYDADAVWLITGRDARDDRAVTSEARGAIVEVLAEFSDRLLDQVRSERDAPSRVSRPGPEPFPSSDSPYPRISSPQ
jgi:hypothetical protein